MFHNIAPTGLLPHSSNTSKAQSREQQKQIERSLKEAVKDLISTRSSSNSGQNEEKATTAVVFNLAHTETVELLKSLDRFFAHGLLKLDKCYWSFVREFIPSEERAKLKTGWNCSSRRHLSLAWLKDSLNKCNLQFQMFGFIACGEEVKRTHYAPGACIRNMILLKRVCLLLDDIAELHFCIEPPYVFRVEETPIALPISQDADGTMSPVQSSNSSLIGVHFAPNLPMNIHRKRERELRSSIGGAGSSFCEVARNSYLDGLVHDLPEVDLSALATAEPAMQSANETTYLLDQMLRAKRKGTANTGGAAQRFFIEEEEAGDEAVDGNEGRSCSSTARRNDPEGSDSILSLVPEDPCSSGTAAGGGGGVGRVQKENELLAKYLITTEEKPSSKLESQPKEEKQQRPASSTSLSNDSDLMAKGSSSREEDYDQLSAMDESEVLLEGEVFLDSGEIIQIQLELCIRDGERVSRLFQVFTGHATGQPLVRYLLLTDQFIYLLAEHGVPREEVEQERNDLLTAASPSSAIGEELAAEAFEQNNLLRLTSDGPPKKFKILISLPLCDIDHLTMGPDGQVLCFHSRRSKFRNMHSQSGHEQRTFLVDTCSRVLAKAVVFAVQKAMGKQNGQLSVTASHSSQLGIVLKRFLRRELGIQKPEIVHHSLVYWQQSASPRQRQQQLEAGTTPLEEYLYVRELVAHQRGWGMIAGRGRGVGEWQQSFVVLRGLMLYQFSDASFKFAQRSLNLREAVEEVHVLEGEGQHTFQLTLSKSTTSAAADAAPPVALQFGCASEEGMNKWVSALSKALSICAESPLPVACMVLMTETHMLLAQEGVNCFVDGFMRSLCAFHMHQSAEIFAIRSDFNLALVLRRDNGLDEWLVFRERHELDRMVRCLRQRWQLPMADCDADEEQDNNMLKPEFNQLLLACAQMPDLWRSVPQRSTFD